MRVLVALIAFVIVAALNLLWWWWPNRPVEIAGWTAAPLQSVSFAPYRPGQSPLTRTFPTADQIEEDLRRLKGKVHAVRTYSSGENLEAVPQRAGKYGLKVWHGAWLNNNEKENLEQINLLIDHANKYKDTVERVIVGNEVLLRKDLTPEQLIGYIRRVKAEVKQPVSYADVWAFWLKYPELAREVDFITIHILPYWEDEPVGVADAALHIVKTYRMIQQAFPGKPILIGEAGWPTRGRDRGPAAANMVNGALFVRTLAKVAKENGFDYNVVEAFDQAWKAAMEGTVGANWGVVDGDRRVKYRMSGPVEANPGWPVQAAAACLLGAAGALWYLRRGSWTVARAAALAALAQLLATLAVCQEVNAWRLGYDWIGDSWALLRIGLSALLTVSLLAAAARALRGEGGRGEGGQDAAGRWLERLVPLYGMAAVASTTLLLVDGRYRDIPDMEFLVPCVGVGAYGLLRMGVLGMTWGKAFAVGRLAAGSRPGGYSPANALAIGLWLSAAAAPLSEAIALAQGDDFLTMHPTWAERWPLLANILVANPEMLVWSAMLLAMSLPFLAEGRRG